MDLNASRKPRLEHLVPWIVLLVLLLCSYTKFMRIPYVGFEFSKGRITEIFQPTTSDSLQIGDQLVRVGDIGFSEFDHDLSVRIFDGVHAGETVPIVVSRNGEIMTIDWKVTGLTRLEFLQRINGVWWLAYVFWLAGTATILFIRPKDTRWQLLVAFNYLTAIWLGAGSGPSHWHMGYSRHILAATIWLCLPVYLHLHWVYPKPFKQLPKFAWIVLYSFGGVFALLDWMQILPPDLFYSGFLIAVLGSIGLTIGHWFLQKEWRGDVEILGLAIGLAMLPSFGVALVSSMGINPPGFVSGGAFLAFPALPGAYFLVAYRRQFQMLGDRGKWSTKLYLGSIFVGTAIVILLSVQNVQNTAGEFTLITGIGVTLVAAISSIVGFSPFLALPALAEENVVYIPGQEEIEIRANRILSLFLFMILVGTSLIVVLVIVDTWDQLSDSSIAVTLIATFVVCLITAIGFSPFQNFIDRFVLGFRVSHDEILAQYSDRIATSLEVRKLSGLLLNELLPNLLIRQSALLRIDSENLEPFVLLGISDEQMPAKEDIPELQALAGKFLSPLTDTPQIASWVRLIISLKASDELVGFWLFGKRDPDDFYAKGDIELLSILSNQIAVALTNIHQAAQLHILYQSNIDRHEEERKMLARNLHDEVLGQMAALSMQISNTDSPEILGRFTHVTDSIRQLITALRPAMLEYGLWSALDEMVDGLSDQYRERTTICLEIEQSDLRYDTKAEEHLYRIAQQACENALHHAQAKEIRIFGEITPEQINLTIEDDGIGLDMNQLDFRALLVAKRFGLAGIFERANLIDADVQIRSEKGQGTQVFVRWNAN